MGSLVFTQPEDLKFLVGYGTNVEAVETEIVKKNLKRLINKNPDIKKDSYSKYVFVFDESSKIDVIFKLSELLTMISEELKIPEEKVIILLSGHQPIEKMNEFAKKYKNRSIFKKIKSVFIPDQNINNLPNWFPKEQLYLDPIIPFEKQFNSN